MSRNVIFMGDPCRGAQATNIQRLTRLLSPIFKRAGIAYSAFISDSNKMPEHQCLDAWRDSLRHPDPFILDTHIPDNSAVVGFELPDAYLSYLNERGIPWVVVDIHPVRFLNDLYFSIHTSFDCDLQSMAVDTAYIELCANIIRLQNKQPSFYESSSTLAIFGQMPVDKAVWFDGKFKQLNDYVLQIDALAQKHDRVFYRPHPGADTSDIDQLICQRYNAEIRSEPTAYQLFCSGEISTVCAISSSSIVEANHFGLNGVFLEPRAKQFGLPISYAALLDNQSFWLDAFLNADSTSSTPPLSSAIPPNLLRDTFGYWSYSTPEKRLEHSIENLKVQIKEQRMSASVRRFGRKLRKQYWELIADISK